MPQTTQIRPKLVCLGEMLIDFMAQSKGCELSEVPAFTRAAGGAPANVAVGVARLGQPSAFLGKAGDDAFGHFLRKTLEASGVAVQGFLLDPAARTSLAFVSLSTAGERDFLFYRQPGADTLLGVDDLDYPALDSAAIFHFGSISLLGGPIRAATLVAIQRAKAAGALISFDPNIRLALAGDPERLRSVILEVLPWCDWLKISEEELDFLVNRPDEIDQSAALNQLHALGPGCICVTLGGAGALLSVAGPNPVCLRKPALAVQVADTTGAGDGFVAGFLATLLGQGPLAAALKDAQLLEAALDQALLVAAYVCTKTGAIPALPSQIELQDFQRQMAK